MTNRLGTLGTALITGALALASSGAAFAQGEAVTNGFYPATQIAITHADGRSAMDASEQSTADIAQKSLDHIFVTYNVRGVAPATLRSYLQTKNVDPASVVDVSARDHFLIVTRAK